MNVVKSYIRPAKKQDPAPPPATVTYNEKSEPPRTPYSVQSPDYSGLATPRSRASLYPDGDFRNNADDHVNEIKHIIALEWVYQMQQEHVWSSNSYGEGVVIRKGVGKFAAAPVMLENERGGLFDAARALNARILMTVNTSVIRTIMQHDEIQFVPLPNGLRLQVLPSIPYLANCQTHQNAAFIHDVGILVVWAENPRECAKRAEDLEKQLIQVFSRGMSGFDEGNEKEEVIVNEVPAEDWDSAEDGVPRENGLTDKPRRIKLNQAFLCAATLFLIIAALASGWRQIAIELVVDKSWIRLAFVVVMPLQIWLALFFMQSVVGCVAQLFGPTDQLKENSKYYSGKAPVRLSRHNLPHVTIQCPVYKEGLYSVIDPTMKSLKAAIATYEMQGGSANIFVNDDGMQLISPEDAQLRQEYYEQNRIGWVARPKHNPKPADGQEGFIRAGKFKKASNMNYAMAVSSRVEDKLLQFARPSAWSQADEQNLYNECLESVKQEDQGRTWAGGNVRMGDYILLIDSDTRVPEDCFLDAVSEMEQSPQVAILQYSSGVMNVSDTFFEMGITFFTNLIYTAIRFAVANGDVAPFVGHNAILRWSAIQDISYQENGVEKFWSEATVSEDFDMALRLQTAGYLVRLGGYTNDGFKEGVSLTVYDELARWEKYAYGCNELIFHPMRYWLTRGPFTPLFRKFIGSCMPLPSKITIMAYIGTYYAIGSAWILTMANYFLIGWFNGHLDHYYIDSFKIYFAIIIVFNCLGNVALAVLRYRSEDASLAKGLWMNFKWILLLTIFLGGVSLHVSQALLCHMFSIDMSWGATAKELVDTTFFEEFTKALRKYKVTFIWCITTTGAMIYLAKFAPPFWRIDFFTAIWPLATVLASHFFLPIVLNPGLMLLTF